MELVTRCPMSGPGFPYVMYTSCSLTVGHVRLVTPESYNGELSIDRLSRYGESFTHIIRVYMSRLSVSGRMCTVMVWKAGSRRTSRIDGLLPNAFTGPSERH